MTYLYLFGLVLGGILLGSSIVLGGHTDAHAGEMHAPDGGHDAEGSVEGFLVAFMSMRFWTFFLTFFGLTGLLFDGLGLVGSAVVTAIVATAAGGGAGYGAVWFMRRMRADDSNSAVSTKDYLGKTGRVLVAFGAGETGKIRVDVKGSTIDLLAVPEEGEGRFELKEEVIIVEMDGTRVKVAKLTAERLSRQ